MKSSVCTVLFLDQWCIRVNISICYIHIFKMHNPKKHVHIHFLLRQF